MTDIEISDNVMWGFYIIGALIALCLIGLIIKYLKLICEILCGIFKCIHKYICCESKCCKSKSYTEV